MKHEYYECECKQLTCMYCSGGVKECVICGGFGSCMPTECPGHEMSDDEQDDVFHDRADFVGGVWVYKVRKGGN